MKKRATSTIKWNLSKAIIRCLRKFSRRTSIREKRFFSEKRKIWNLITRFEFWKMCKTFSLKELGSHESLRCITSPSYSPAQPQTLRMLFLGRPSSKIFPSRHQPGTIHNVYYTYSPDGNQSHSPAPKFTSRFSGIQKRVLSSRTVALGERNLMTYQ